MRIHAAILILFITLTTVSPLSEIFVPTILTSSSQFILQSYVYKSLAGYSEVYPGSKRVYLAVVFYYSGASEIVGVTACLTDLPRGISPSTGYTACSVAYKPGGGSYNVVRPGDVVEFRYRIDISQDVSPGRYDIVLNITYRDVSTNQLRYELHSIEINVSSYPPLKLSILEVYWDPDAYPGSKGVHLNVVVRNDGKSVVVSGVGVLKFLNDVFYPKEYRIDIPRIDIGDMVVLTFRNIDVSVSAAPHREYVAVLKINATAETRDGVRYSTSYEVPLYISISEAPSPYITVLDFGVTAPHVANDTVKTSIYIVFRNLDNTVELYSVTAYIEIVRGASFINNSLECIRILQGPYRYGDTFTLISCPLIVRGSDSVDMRIRLTVFGSRNGAEFWSTRILSLRIPIEIPRFQLYVVASWWSSNVAYPGSRNIDLVVAVENHDVALVRDVIAELRLPRCFYPHTITAIVSRIDVGTRASITFHGISIDPSCRAGIYIANLTLSGIAAYDDGSYHTIVLNYSIPLIIASKAKDIIEVLYYGWRSDRAYTSGFGFEPYVVLYVAKPYTINSLVLEAYLPPQLMFTDVRRHNVIAIQQSLTYGQSIDVSLGRVVVTTHIPGTYPVVLRIRALASYNGVEQVYVQNTTIVFRILKPVLNISIIDTGLLGGATQRTYGSTAYIVMQIKQIDRVQSLVVKLELSSGARYIEGRNTAIWYTTSALEYGSIVTARFQGIEIVSTAREISGRLCISAVMTMDEGAKYTATKCFNVRFKLMKNVTYLLLARVETLYNGRFAPLLPTARGVALRVHIINLGVDRINSLNIRALLPKGFILRGYRGTCHNGVAPGATCYVDIVIDVEKVKPGEYTMLLEANYSMNREGAIVWTEQRLTIPITVSTPSRYVPNVVPIAWFWGTATPITVYEHSREVPLTIVLMNRGRYAVSGVVVKVLPINTSVGTIVDSQLCSSRLEPGMSCQATLYLDLAKTGPGTIWVNVSVNYVFTDFGTYIEISRLYTLKLRVVRYAGGKGLEVVDVYWHNHWPVYPGTENATLHIVLANRWPYRIGGLKLILYLPLGFFHNGKQYASTYVSGPIDSLATVSVSFTITIGRDVKPGVYNGTLVVNYVVDSGDGGLNVTEVHTVLLKVHSLKEAIEVLTPEWLYGAPEPGTYGSILVLHIRNNLIPVMKGPVLRIKLPKGVTCSLNNKSIAILKAMPARWLYSVQSSDMQLSKQQIIRALLTYEVSEDMRSTRYTLGDVVSFVIPLNIGSNVTVFTLNATLDFIDQWNNVRRLNFTVNVEVLGSARIIDVYTDPVIKIYNGKATFTVHVVNRGSAPIYNVYLILIPHTPLLIPLQGVRYVPELSPGKARSVTFTLIYNPISATTITTQPLQGMSFVATLNVVYRDVTGFQKQFNVSLAAIVEPFVQIVLSSDTRARYSTNLLTVSGTVINYGISRARSVVITVYYGNCSSSAFVGDLDPASQIAFRVDVECPEFHSKAVVMIMYRDEYNRVYATNFTLPVLRIITSTPSTLRMRVVPWHSYMPVIAAIICFLIVVGYAIVRLLKKYGERLESSAETSRESEGVTI